jgi:hypothetical protein
MRYLLTVIAPMQEEVKGGGKMLRNQSAPHFAVMSRNYSTVFTPIPRYPTFIMCCSCCHLRSWYCPSTNVIVYSCYRLKLFYRCYCKKKHCCYCPHLPLLFHSCYFMQLLLSTAVIVHGCYCPIL